jgi:hypothetical protein
MSVKMVKLVSGEEVLCKIEEHGDTVTLKTPVVLVMQRDESGQPLGLGMQPWLLLAQKPEVTIALDKIILQYVPRAEIVNQYNELTGSIVTAPAGALDSKGKLVL